MAITSERLKQTFSEGGAQEIYQEVKAEDDFLGFARRYVFDVDFRVARSALWGLTKATDKELSELQVLLNELTDQAMQRIREDYVRARRAWIAEIRKDAQKEFAMGDVEQEVFDDFISKLDHEVDYED